MSKNEMRDVKAWENGLKTWDLSAEWAKRNPQLTKHFGQDRHSYESESLGLSNEYWTRMEPAVAHGYPATAWLQLGLLYGVGLYTAQEQGIVTRSTFFARYWRAHYFDWLTFARRGAIYAWAGGLAAGIVLFGSPDLTVKRAISKYHFWFTKAELKHSP